MRELIIMFLQGLLYIAVSVYIIFASVEVYKFYKQKHEPTQVVEQEEQPAPSNQQPLYILSPGKD